MNRMRGPALVPLATVLVALLAGCEGASQPAFDPNQPATGPLTALSECGELPEPIEADPVVGAALPEGAVVTSVTVQGPLTTIIAEVPTTPVNIRIEYEERGDLELLTAEDEVFEAELLVSDGSHRTYVKASAICQTGTTLLAIVAAEDDAAPLPTPAGGGTPSS